jgi:hypothetical protein
MYFCMCQVIAIHISLLQLLAVGNTWPCSMIHSMWCVTSLSPKWFPSAEHTRCADWDLHSYRNLSHCTKPVYPNHFLIPTLNLLRSSVVPISDESWMWIDAKNRVCPFSLNLYLYRPPSSAQSPSILYGLIFGTLHCYYWQNNNHHDFDHFTTLFFQCLEACGHSTSNLSHLFTKAAKKVEQSTIPQAKVLTS